jgi:hypothetical protein
MGKYNVEKKQMNNVNIDNVNKLKKTLFWEKNEINSLLNIKSDIIKWTFWKKEIPIEQFIINGNKKVLINIHWTYWSIHGWDNKYLNMAYKLKKEWISNVVLYQSSRNLIKWDNITYEDKMKWFMWKTFEDEINDCKKVLDYIIENAEKNIWVKGEDLEITLNWNSLWWMLSIILSDSYSQIKNISWVWAGFRIEKRVIPILSSYYQKEELLKYLKNYKWNFLLQYGTEDDIFDSKDFQRLITSLENAKVSFVKMIWVDHTFKKLNWEVSSSPYDQVYNNIKLLINWSLSFWEVYLETEQERKIREDNDYIDLFV